MAEVIKEIDWNGNHYTFTNTFKSTGTKSHDILTMTDDNGNSFTGETTWINRPWHRFDLEEAIVQVLTKAFGSKAKDLILKINQDSNSVTKSIDRFFSEFKPEDIQSAEERESERTTVEDRKKALADFLEVDVADIEEDGDNEFDYDGETYLVLTDEEADEEFDESVRNYWEEGGFEYVSDNFQDWVLENCVDEEYLKDTVREEIQYRVDDMNDEEVADECIQQGIVTSDEVYDEDSELRDDVDFDDLRDLLVDTKFNDVDDYAEYLKDMGFSAEQFKDHLDDEKVIEALKDDIEVNGSRGSEIATYNGVENEQNDLYIYRID